MTDPSCDCGACCTQCGHSNDCTSQQPDDDGLDRTAKNGA